MLSKFVLALFLISFSLVLNATAQDAPKVLSSVARLSIHSSDGRTLEGNGFLISRDGILATALHLVDNARRVTAKFPDGELYECSGIIDSDIKRNVALVRIKEFGRPLLKAEAREIVPDLKLFAPVVKDGAFGTVPIVTGASVVYDDRVHFAVAGEIPLGNSGGPVVDAAGVVVGFLTMRMVEDKPRAFVMAIAPVLALDTTLPTKPFGQPTAAQPSPTPTPAPTPEAAPAEDLDVLIGKAIAVLSDNMDVIAWADIGIKGFGFRNGVPTPVYDFKQDLDGAAGKLAAVQTADPLRQKVQKSLLQAMALQRSSSEDFIRSVVIGQQTGAWGAQSQDAFNRAASTRKALEALLLEIGPSIAELEKVAPKLTEQLYPQHRYLLGLAQRASGYRLGVVSYARRQYFVLVLYNDSLGNKMGLKPGDTIKSFGGTDLTRSNDIEDLKLLIKQNLGKKIEAVVLRNNKEQRITLKIPKQIPAEALYTN
jgi:S1-C subfamily serine protease